MRTLYIICIFHTIVVTCRETLSCHISEMCSEEKGKNILFRNLIYEISRFYFHTINFELLYIEFVLHSVGETWSYKYPQLVSDTGLDRGMRCDEAPILRSVNCKESGRPRLTHHHRVEWNEAKWMSVEKWCNEIWLWESERNPEKYLPRLRFVSTTKPTWSDRDENSEPNGGSREPNRLRHRAA